MANESEIHWPKGLGCPALLRTWATFERIFLCAPYGIHIRPAYRRKRAAAPLPGELSQAETTQWFPLPFGAKVAVNCNFRANTPDPALPARQTAGG